MIKKRDISRAYKAKEGSIGTLAERFHASSTTVQDAIKRKADAWQADIDLAKATAAKGKHSPQVTWPKAWEYASATLVPTYAGGATKVSEYIIRIEGHEQNIKVAGASIVPAVNVLGQNGWEVVHVKESGDQYTLLLKRPHD